MRKHLYDKESVKDLINNQRKTIQQVATELGCGKATAQRIGAECGVTFKGRRSNEKYDDARHLVLNYYKANSKNKNRDFSLTEEEFYSMIQLPCRYCGREKITSFRYKRGNQVFHKNKQPFFYTGIDRLDSSKGYTKENSAPCCAVCNRAKMDMSEEEFLQWIKTLVKFHSK